MIEQKLTKTTKIYVFFFFFFKEKMITFFLKSNSDFVCSLADYPRVENNF